MGKPTNENGLLQQIVKAVKTKYPNAWVFKVHGGPMQVAGIPDLLIVVQGRIIGAEVKFQRPGESESHARGRATTLQINQINKIRAAGGTADVVLSIDETLALIEQALTQSGEEKDEHRNDQ